MIKVCSYCDVVLEIDLTIPMDYPSHGICIDCCPGFLREAGFPEKEIKEIMRKEFGVILSIVLSVMQATPLFYQSTGSRSRKRV